MKSLLIFDIDGTLLLSGGCGKAAFERAFEDLFGIKDSWQDTVPDGKTDPIIFNEIAQSQIGRTMSSEEYGNLSSRYTEYFSEEVQKAAGFRVMPGVHDLLHKLSSDSNTHLCIGTGNMETVSWLKIRKANLEKFFSCGGFGTHFSKRVDILKAAHHAAIKYFNTQTFDRVYVIGDTRYDVEAAHEMSFRSVGVKTGHLSEVHFNDSPPQIILENFTNSEALFSELGIH